MAVYEINLAKGRVIPANQRRIWYRVLFLYLAVVGTVFAFLANHVTRDLLAALARREELPILERQCLNECAAESGGILQYSRQLEAEMAWQADTLEAVQSVISRRTGVAQILLGLATPLPPGSSLLGADISSSTRELGFEVVLLEDRSAGGLSPLSLINAWTRDPALTAEVTEIRSTNSQRSTLNGRGVLIWSFTGRLTGKGA